MSSQNYPNLTYGMFIPTEHHVYKHILSKLAEKFPKLNSESKNDFDFIYEVAATSSEYSHISLLYNIDYMYENVLDRTEVEYSETDGLILSGSHSTPSFTSKPFDTTEEVVEHYKSLYGDLLPENFNYESYIGQLLYVTYG